MPMTGKDMLKLAKQNGWNEIRTKGSHHVVEKRGCENVSIPVHGNKDLRKGTEQQLLKDLGLKK